MLISNKYELTTNDNVKLYKEVSYEIQDGGYLNVETSNVDGIILLKEKIEFEGLAKKYCVKSISYSNISNQSGKFNYINMPTINENKTIFYDNVAYDNTQLLILLPSILAANRELYVYVPTTCDIIPIIVKKNYSLLNTVDTYKFIVPDLAIARYNKETLILEEYFSQTIRIFRT